MLNLANGYVDGRRGDGVRARFVAAFVAPGSGSGLVTAACGSSIDSSASTSASSGKRRRSKAPAPGSSDPDGHIVTDNHVITGGPADLAGLTGGDIIVSMSGKTINTTGDLFAQLSLHKTGDIVSVDYYRGVTKKTTQVTLG